MTLSKFDTVAILDAGSQFSKLIDRRIRELRVKSEIIPLSTSAIEIQSKNYKAIIISGGPGSVFKMNSQPFDSDILHLDIPILGICYGMQLIVKLFGGKVESMNNNRQDGQIDIIVTSSNILYDCISKRCKVLLTHGDICTQIPDDFMCDAKSLSGIVCGISHKRQPLFGVQYHPEVTLTEIGLQLFENFLFKIAKCEPQFTITSRLDSTMNYITNFVSKFNNDYHVLVLLSGGVDSLVCGTLIGKSLPPNKFTLIHIDHGFMRHSESKFIKQQLEAIGIQLKVYKCHQEFLYAKTALPCRRPLSSNLCVSVVDENNTLEEFLVADPHELLITPTLNEGSKQSPPRPVPTIMIDSGPLCTTIDPEHKRKIIGDTFMRVCSRVINELNLDINKTIIAQGTLRPDLIESASSIVSGCAETIKTHHNDTNLVRELRKKGLIMEPLKDFHKDEVRKLGIDLGLQPQLVYRHPFPGPGLAIRILCNNSTEPKINFDIASMQSMLNFLINYHTRIKMKRTNSYFDEIKSSFTDDELNHLDDLTSKHSNYPFFCHILPINSVGVQGDGRSYKHPLVISSDMPEPIWPNLIDIAKFITKVCHNINRVVYAFGDRILERVIDQLTISNLSPPIVDILRSADHIVTTTLKQYGEYNRVSQMPSILIPVQFDDLDFNDHHAVRFSIVLRPVITTDFMTALPAVPGVDISIETLYRIQERILLTVPRISKVLYDLTSKPPGTIEWE